MSANDDPVPPHNLEAERAVLGAVLVKNEAVITAEQLVRAVDFWRRGTA